MGHSSAFAIPFKVTQKRRVLSAANVRGMTDSANDRGEQSIPTHR